MIAGTYIRNTILICIIVKNIIIKFNVKTELSKILMFNSELMLKAFALIKLRLITIVSITFSWLGPPIIIVSF